MDEGLVLPGLMAVLDVLLGNGSGPKAERSLDTFCDRNAAEIQHTQTEPKLKRPLLDDNRFGYYTSLGVNPGSLIWRRQRLSGQEFWMPPILKVSRHVAKLICGLGTKDRPKFKS